MKKKQDIVMLTIDSSTKKTGIAVWINGYFKKRYLINYDEKDNKGKSYYKDCKTMDTRYPLMVRDIYNILNQYQPKILYIEDEVVSRNMATCRFLFRLQGVIEGWCLSNGCEFNTVRPSQWRSACGFEQGKGHDRDDLKKQAIAFVKKIYGIDVTDDEADAICIGYYVLKLFGLVD